MILRRIFVTCPRMKVVVHYRCYKENVENIKTVKECVLLLSEELKQSQEYY